MKTLILFAQIGFGVAGILYARVDLGMSWHGMRTWAEDLMSTKLLPVIVMAWIPVVAILWVRYRRGH